MRILHLLLVVLFLVLQGAAGQEVFSRLDNSCLRQNGRCVRGICRYPYYWIADCSNGYSCCRK
uniref:Beta-defensin 167 n=1 Tax=Garrulax canorus TaxID=238855 RepID=A0A3G1B4U2_9PASS|nr:beta-defensin 167 [Garrulax canorus]